MSRAPDARPVRILYTVPRGFTGKGGIERQTGYLAAAVRDPAWRGGDGLEIGFMPTRGPGLLVFSVWHMLVALARIAAARLRGETLIAHLTVSLRTSTWRKLILSEWARLLGAHVVLHLRGAGYDRFYAARPAFARRLIRRLFRSADRVIALGAPWRTFMIETLGVAPERALVLANAVPDPGAPDPGAPDPDGRPPRTAGPLQVLFLGQLGARKGVPELVAALASLPAEMPDWRCTIAGDGDAAPYRRAAEQAGLGDRIALPGWVGPADAAQLLAGADVFVLPSHSENLPVAVLEAASYGVAIVTTPVGAVPDHFHDGENALIVPPGEVPALAAALARLLAEPALRARLGAGARATFEAQFSITAYRDHMAAIWRQVLAEGQGAGQEGGRR